MGRGNRVSIFWKIVIMFIVFIMILYFLNVMANIQRQNEVRKEIAESTKLKIEFYLASLEKDVSNIIRMQTTFLTDEDIETIGHLKNLNDDFIVYSTFNSLRDKLKAFVSMNYYVESASIYLTNFGKEITDTSIGDFDTYREDIFKELQKKDIPKNHALPFTTINNNIYIIITPNIFEYSDKATTLPKFVICAKISKHKLEAFLKKLSNGDNSSAVMLGDDRGINLLNSSDPQIGGDLINHLKNRQEDFKEEVTYLGENPEKYFISYAKSGSLHSTLLVYTPEKKFFESLSRYTTWTWVLSLLTICFILVSVFWMRSMLLKPLKKLITAFDKVENGEMNISVSYSSHDEFGYLYDKFNNMFKNLKSLIKEVYEQKLLVQKAELKQLQYQINPHFLYNSLLILYNLIRMDDNECAMVMAKHLGNYYQYITRSGAEEVPLSKELNHARDYVAIQSIRCSKRITVYFDEINEDMNDIMVPRLIIQPILENAFNHGLKEKISDGLIYIRIFKDEKQIKICVEDNGEDLSDEKLAKLQSALELSGKGAETTGLVNVHRRLQIKFGKESGLFVSRGEVGGLKAEVRIVDREENRNA